MLLKRKQKIKRRAIQGLVFFAISFFSLITNGQVTIAYDIINKPVAIGVSRIEKAITLSGKRVQELNLNTGSNQADIIICLSSGSNIQKQGLKSPIKIMLWWFVSGTLVCELDDMETWAYLSAYFAGKLRGGRCVTNFQDVRRKCTTAKSGCVAH